MNRRRFIAIAFAAAFTVSTRIGFSSPAPTFYRPSLDEFAHMLGIELYPWQRQVIVAMRRGGRCVPPVGINASFARFLRWQAQEEYRRLLAEIRGVTSDLK